MGVIRQPLLRNLRIHYFRHDSLQSHLPQSPSFSTVSQGSGVQKTKGGGGYIGLVAVTAAAAIVGGSYYAMTRTRLPTTNPSVPQPQPSTATYTDDSALASSPPPLSAHDELLNRREDLLTELAVLRTKKRDKLVDLKKKEIKEEIHIIESGLAKLQRS